MLSTEEPQRLYSAVCSLLRCKVTPRQEQVHVQKLRAIDQQVPLISPGFRH